MLKIKKIFGILLVVIFVVSVTAASVSASSNVYQKNYKRGQSDGYTIGRMKGYQEGCREGMVHSFKCMVQPCPARAPSFFPYNKKLEEYYNKLKKTLIGYRDGFNVGYEKGRKEGFSAGYRSIVKN